MKPILLTFLALAPIILAAEKKPNIVLILADDLGYGDIGPFGSKKNRTPNLDRLAAEGAKLTSFYSAPVCSPSRAQLLTGSYAKRVSLPQVLFPASPIGLSKDEPTVATILKSQGYATTAIGKWHVGDHPDFLPTAHGFDSYFGLPYSNDMIREPGHPRRGSNPPLPLVKDTEVIQVIMPEDQKSLTARYTEAAVGFIREKKDQPFFVYLPHTAVHVPLYPGKDFQGKSSNGLYGDWVEEVDWGVGRIITTLKELGLAENTLVIFTSDNGPWLTQGDQGGESGPLRGGKGGTFEGGVRVPTIAWWPGNIPAGIDIGNISGNIDLLPTFATLSGAVIPGDHKIDGKDLTPLLLGKTTESQRDIHYYFSGNNLQAIRSGPWKLAIARQSEANGKPDPDARKPFSPTLYNLESDLGETKDVASEHPEIVSRIKALADQMDADLGITAVGPGVRPPGKVEKPVGLWLPGQPPSPAEVSAHYDSKPLADLKPGDTLPATHAPQIANKPFAVSISVAPTKPDGIILAQGGRTFGYALYLHGGKLHFTVRNREAHTISTPAPASAKYTIETQLGADGTLTLLIDGKPAATGKAASLISSQPGDGFSLGHDSGAPVADYHGTGAFEGTLSDLRVTVR